MILCTVSSCKRTFAPCNLTSLYASFAVMLVGMTPLAIYAGAQHAGTQS